MELILSDKANGRCFERFYVCQ